MASVRVQYMDEKYIIRKKSHCIFFLLIIRRFSGKVKDDTLLGLLDHEDKYNETIRHGETSQRA